MKSHVTAMIKSLQEMENAVLIGGFESKLATNLTINETDGKTYFKSIEMIIEEHSRTRQEPKDYTEVRKSILTSLQTFLTERFQIDDDLLTTIDPFVKFEENSDIEKVHSMLAPDLELANLSLQFQDISNDPTLIQNKKNLSEIIMHLSKSDESREFYHELIIVLARIAACTPHSADVERCISTNNLLKTKQRSRLTIPTENKYLYIRMNMPVLTEWNPTAAAKLFVEGKARRNRDMTTSSQISRRQNYFKGVLSEADQCEDSEESKCDKTDKKFSIFDF